MKCKVARKETYIRMKLEGSLNIKNADQLLEYLNDFDFGESHILLLNLSGLTRIDSTGLQALKNFSENLKKPHIRFFLIGLRPKQMQIIERAGLETALPILNDEELQMAFPDEPSGGS